MCVYLQTKFQVSNIIPTSFRQREGGTLPPPFSSLQIPQNKPQTPKKPNQIGVNGQ